MKQKTMIGIAGILWGVFVSSSLFAADGDSDAATKRLFRRLTGANIYPEDPRFAQIKDALDRGNQLEAARIVTADDMFYSVTLRNWSTKWSTDLDTTKIPFNDLHATVIGIVRDRLDFRNLLVGDFYYRGKDGIGLPRVNPKNNTHYEEIERNALKLTDVLVRDQRDQMKVGVFASRGFANSFYLAGTNRRAVKFTLENFLCAKISRWRDPAIPDDYVRRDVNRTPTGALSEYQAECRGCHAPMDALSGAFAQFDFVENAINVSQSVQLKYASHPNVAPYGYVVNSGKWKNYLAMNQNAEFGFRGPTEGTTLEEFATMISNAKSFSRCMVKTAVAEVCPNGTKPKANQMIDRLTTNFENSNYDMRQVFEQMAIDPDC